MSGDSGPQEMAAKSGQPAALSVAAIAAVYSAGHRTGAVHEPHGTQHSVIPNAAAPGNLPTAPSTLFVLPFMAADPHSGQPGDAWWLSDVHPGGANIAAAWATAVGSGVTVGLVDSAVNTLHQDLAGAVANGLTPLAASLLADPHGTRVAGLIAGRVDNQIGGMGVAPGAVIIASPITFGATVDILRVSLALMAQSTVDVSNNSWGFGQAFADNARNPAFDPILGAISHAVTAGRDGLGTALVFAGGNGRLMINGVNLGDDSNFHGLTNSRHTIAVGASDASGQAALFSSPGTNLLLSAPGSGLVTADGLEAGASGQANVAGTSFAAPLVSGTIALMLQVNPALGYRDIQMILLLTARATVPVDGTATGHGAQSNAANLLNGGGLVFDRDIGFGILDAAAAVRLAAVWTLQSHVGNEVQIAATAGPDLHTQDNRHELVVNVAQPEHGFALGWVELALSVTAPALRQMSIMLESPSGTLALIAPNLQAVGNQTTLSFDFSSLATWGEAVDGTWRIILTLPDGAAPPIVHQADLRFFGDQDGDTGYDAGLHYFNRGFAAQATADPDRAVILQQGDDPGGLIFAALNTAVTVNLAAATGQIDGVDFGLEGVFDRIVGGAANDDLRGSTAFDRLSGGGGRDLLMGDDGSDSLQGQGGADTLMGGQGDDSMLGGADNDTYIVDSVGDAVFETTTIDSSTDAGGLDAVHSEISFSLDATTGLRFVERLVLTGTTAITGMGNDLANLLRGNSADNLLTGGLGNDSLHGGAGHDSLFGGSGDDTYTVNSPSDRVFETPTTFGMTDAGGLDTVQSGVTFSIDTARGVRFVERLTLTGTDAINGIGNALSNVLTGNSANNGLTGRLGDDILTGGAGNDTFVFNTRPDTTNVDRITDFNVADDRVRLHQDIFAGMAAGPMAAQAFAANLTGRANDAHDRIIYETDTGRLYYDADGSAAGARVLFAMLTADLALTHADIFVF